MHASTVVKAKELIKGLHFKPLNPHVPLHTGLPFIFIGALQSDAQ